MITQTDTQTFTKKLHVGKDTDGYTYAVEIELRETEAVSPRMTIDHQPVTTYLELSICGHVKGRGGYESFGQNTDDFRNAEFIKTPHGMNGVEILALCDLWDRWHLNGMKAGCCHQPLTGSYDDNRGAECPHGYKYGSAWLVEFLPDDVIADIRRIAGVS